MYQAIVFLPLLGAILAGIIALAGAHARFPGGPPGAGADSHGPAPAHALDAPAAHGAVAHPSHPEEREPPATGSR